MNEKPRPDTRGVAQLRQAPALELVQDIYAGTRRMQEKAGIYLPQHPAEGEDAWRSRVENSVMFNGFRRTVKGLVGMIFRKDPAPGEDVPEVIVEDFEDIDMAGRAMPVFARDAATALLRDGHAHIFVDFPIVADPAGLTLADEQNAGARPYWTLVEKGQVLRLRSARIGGEMVATHFAYLTTVVEAEGFDEIEKAEVREYDLAPEGVVWRAWRKADEKDDDSWAMVASGVMTMDRIPLATGYAVRHPNSAFESDPPLEDLAYENLRHFRARSDVDNVLHVGNVPILTLTGVDDDNAPLPIGPGVGLKLPRNATAQYTEAQGYMVEQSIKELLNIEKRMAALGLAMLQSDTRAAETAEAKRIDAAETHSGLSTAARGLEDLLEEALYYHARWRKLDDGGGVDINRDFEGQKLTPQHVQALSALVEKGQLSLETMWEALVRGDTLPDSFDPEEEKARLEGSEEANALRAVVRELRTLQGEPPQPGANGMGPEEDDDGTDVND